jgi:hypothetical protein
MPIPVAWLDGNVLIELEISLLTLGILEQDLAVKRTSFAFERILMARWPVSKITVEIARVAINSAGG